VSLTFADLDIASVESFVLTAYERIAATTLYPGDPVRLMMETLAYVAVVQNQIIDLAGKQNLLAFATGEHLDYIGMMVGTPRLGHSPATCKQRFRLEAPLAFAVTVPPGTRVTTKDRRAVFMLPDGLTIAPGETEAVGVVVATKPGAAGNGLVPGQIDAMIDPVAYVTGTDNVSVTMLGADVESDSRYRSRVQQAPESFTCAGPVGSYRNLVMAVHQDIADAGIWSPKPGTVDIRPVMVGGLLPPPEIIDAVRQAVSADDVRPLTDTVTVAPPEPIPYHIDVSWSLVRANEPLLSTLTDQVAAAAADFIAWQSAVPGRDIQPDELQARMKAAGARRVLIREPLYTTLPPYQLAQNAAVNIEFIGVEDD